MSYATWDIETTVHQRFRRKATPFGDINWCVTHGFKHKGDLTVTEHRFGRQRPGPGWLRPVLKGIKLLCGFNIKFDLLHALQDADNLAAWMDFVVAGGNVWDCQLAEYLLEGMDQRNHMLSLDEVAPRYGGTIKFDEVKALWEAGVMTEDIEPALLSRYLCGEGPELGDVGNTEMVALKQIERARQCGQLKSILLNMGSLICSTEMERNGMFADKARGLILAEELAKKVAEHDALLAGFLPANLPFDFNWNSPKQKSALIFGGTVKYKRYEYQLNDGTYTFEAGHPNQAFVQMDVVCCTVDEDRPGLCFEGQELKAGMVVPLEEAKQWNVRVVRFAGGKNANEVKTKKVKRDDPSKPKGRMGEDLYTFEGFTTPLKKWEGEVPGVYSTSADVIEELGVRNIPFLTTLAAMSKMIKDLGTYYITVDPESGEEKGMLSLVDAFGIIHHKINHTSTVTGRFSSSDPNLQNIPKGNKSDVKTLFISRWGADGLIIQSDFSSLEIYVQAILTRCEQLIKDLKAGLDMHVKRLALKEGKPYDEVLVLCKGDKAKGIEADKEWDYKRTGAKVFSFQRAYGAGAAKIAASTGMPVHDVELLIEAESQEYPEIDAHFVKRTAEIKNGRKPGMSVPHPEFPAVMCNLGRAYIRTPDGKLYAYQESPSPEYLVKKGVFASFSPTQIKNYEVQGTGGEWMKAAMWLMVRAWYARRNFDGLSLLVNTVHDAAYSDSHKGVALEAAALMHACMEAASDFMEYWFAWALPLPVPSDTSWGTSMMDEEKIPGLNELAAKFRVELRSQYMGGYVPSYLH